jgi:hypothetical protein
MQKKTRTAEAVDEPGVPSAERDGVLYDAELARLLEGEESLPQVGRAASRPGQQASREPYGFD